VQRHHIRILILVILLMTIIGIILFHAGKQMDAIDHQMPVIGCALPTLSFTHQNS
jgi:hypothetical protein